MTIPHDVQAWVESVERQIAAAKVSVYSNMRVPTEIRAALVRQLEAVYRTCRALAKE